MLEDEDGKISTGYYFYDLNAKINHKFSNNDRLYLSLYMGDDVIYTKFRNKHTSIDSPYDDYQMESSSYLKMNWNWGNIVSSIRWNHAINNKLFMNLTGAYTRYRFDMGLGNPNNS